MNKSELTNAIAAKAGLTKEQAKKALEATIGTMKESLSAGDKVTLVGFGNFSIVERAARKGFNPKTKAPINIEAKKAIKFKAGSELSESL